MTKIIEIPPLGTMNICTLHDIHLAADAFVQK